MAGEVQERAVEQLAKLVARRADLDQQIAGLVAMARQEQLPWGRDRKTGKERTSDGPASWEQIGAALGMTRAGAWKRYGP